MINDNTILSSFDDRPTLLEWLKKVEDALKTDTATAVSVENPTANTYVFKITFADGKTLSSGNVVFPNAVQDVSIKNGHIIVTQISGTQTDLGAINPYAGTIVENAETDTTEIGNNVSISGNVATGGNLGVTGQAVVGGRLQVNSSIISNGEIRGGNISGTKFLLGTEEMPLVKANPTGEATATLEKVKIGDVAYNVGGGSSNDREITLTIPYSSDSGIVNNKTYVDDDIWNKIKDCYYDTIKIRYNDGRTLGIFNVLIVSIYEFGTSKAASQNYVALNVVLPSASSETTWYGSVKQNYNTLYIGYYTDNTGKYIEIIPFQTSAIPTLTLSKFDERYKLADKPTQDGNYILKASVSGGNVTYTWELQQ